MAENKSSKRINEIGMYSGTFRITNSYSDASNPIDSIEILEETTFSALESLSGDDVLAISGLSTITAGVVLTWNESFKSMTTDVPVKINLTN